MWSLSKKERDTRICSPAWRGSRTNGPVSLDSDGHYGSIQNDAERKQIFSHLLTISQNMLKRFPLRIKRPKHAHESTRLIVSRYGTGAQLITDQGPAFMSSFFQETCKVLGIGRIRTTSYHPASNGTLERWHKDLHTALWHYINAANKKLEHYSPIFSDGA